ncbi:MAG TPA: hypothetical protein VGF74_09660 [Thermoleophilaceae bacterium]
MRLRRLLPIACLVGTLLAFAADAPASANPQLPRRATSFLNSVGVNVHMSYFDTAYRHWEEVRDKLAELGVRHVRDGACPGCTQQRARLLALAAAGIKTDYIMGQPGGDTSLRRLVSMVSGPMRSTVDALEGPNEFDRTGGYAWARRLRAYQRRLYRLVRGTPALSGVPVFGPTLVFGNDFRRLGSLARYADFGNMHPYSGGQVPAATLGFNRSQEQFVARGKPLVATEAGFHNALRSLDGNRPVSEAAQAEYVPRLFLDFFSSGISRTYLYELLDEKSNRSRSNAQEHYGLLRHNFSEKPAFRTLKALLHSLGPAIAPTFPLVPLDYGIGPGAPSDLERLLLQTGSSTYALVLWRNVSVWDTAALRSRRVKPATVDVALGGGAHAVAVRDLRLRKPVPASGSEVHLRLTGMPKIIGITR